VGDAPGGLHQRVGGALDGVLVAGELRDGGRVDHRAPAAPGTGVEASCSAGIGGSGSLGGRESRGV